MDHRILFSCTPIIINTSISQAYHRGLSSGSSLIYSLLDDGANVPFYLDEKSGQLVLLAPLDHEKTKEISFKVRRGKEREREGKGNQMREGRKDLVGLSDNL